jgi:radical SAM protein with 4Fe4S-binding SPASM domain
MAGKIRSFTHFFGKIAFIKDAIMRRLIANTVKFGYQIPCLAGKVSLVVDEKTNVYPCEMLSSIGNLREKNYDFSKILDSEKLKTVVNKIKCSNCFCTHECSYSSNILFNIPLIFTIFKQYIFYCFKKLFKYEKFFKEFDDLKYYKSNKKNGFYGQKGDLYKGTNFGTLNEANKTKDPTVPF